MPNSPCLFDGGGRTELDCLVRQGVSIDNLERDEVPVVSKQRIDDTVKVTYGER